MTQKYARMVGNVVQEVFSPLVGFTLADCLHPDVAALFVAVPDFVVTGSTKAGDGTWSAPIPPQPSTPSQVPYADDKRVTRLAFLNRITAQERIAIREAASAGDMVITDILDLMSAANFIDLSSQDLVSSIDYLKSKSLLTMARAFSILNNPIQAAERP